MCEFEHTYVRIVNFSPFSHHLISFDSYDTYVRRYVNISEASNVIYLLSLYSHPGYKILSDILFVRTHLRLDLFRNYFLISKYTQFDSQMYMSILSDVIIVEMNQCLGITLKYQKSRLSFEIYISYYEATRYLYFLLVLFVRALKILLVDS